MRDKLDRWRRGTGVSVLFPEDYSTDPSDFRRNPAVDYGKFIEKQPQFLLLPKNETQVVSCAKFLEQHDIPYKVRGSAHSAGGQVLIDEGAVVDMREMCGIVADDPDAETITVQAGIWWLKLWQHLHPQHRRPLLLTDNIRTTVCGTLAVGGFCDGSHLYGLQAEGVTQIKMVVPRGDVLTLSPEDKLFKFVLAGRGQLGIMTEATVRTMRRPGLLTARLFRWHTLEQLAEATYAIARHRFYEYLRSRYYWHLPDEKLPVVTVAGNFTNETPTEDPAPALLAAPRCGTWEQLDLYAHMQTDPYRKWKLCSPAMEVVLPLPAGLLIAQRVRQHIVSGGLHRFLSRGSSVMIAPCHPETLPLAPFPENSQHCMILAIRPQIPRESVEHYLPLLQRIGMEVLEAGGKIYLMSIEVPHPDFLSIQFGKNLAEILRLKSELDPKHLLNPGLLTNSAAETRS